MAEQQRISQDHEESGFYIDSSGNLIVKRKGTSLLQSDGTTIALLKAITATLTGDASLSGGVFTATHDSMHAIRIPSASGIDTDANNGGLAGCENSGDVTATEASETYCKIYDDSASAYANLEDAGADDFTQWALLPANTQDDDAAYFGADVPFCELMLDMSATVQTYTDDALVWEYWDGSAWSALTLAHDYTDATAQDGLRSFGRDGAISFVPPTDWAATTVDSVEAYWIRCNAGTAANISQVGITNGKRHYLCSPADGFVVPHDCVVSSIAIRDEAATVHTAADIKIMLVNFTTGAHSGALTFAQDKRSDRWASLSLACSAGDVLGVVVVQEDGTNELGPATIELGITLS
jgi:hypothetical protein